MESQLSYFKSWKMMLWKCCTQYASKYGKLSSGHRTGKGQFSLVGCHFLLQCMKVKSESEVAQLCLTLSDPMDCSPPGSFVLGFSRQEPSGLLPCVALTTRGFQSPDRDGVSRTLLRGKWPAQERTKANKPKTKPWRWCPAELFKTLKDDAVKVLHSVCQQI